MKNIDKLADMVAAELGDETMDKKAFVHAVGRGIAAVRRAGTAVRKGVAGAGRAVKSKVRGVGTSFTAGLKGVPKSEAALAERGRRMGIPMKFEGGVAVAGPAAKAAPKVPAAPAAAPAKTPTPPATTPAPAGKPGKRIDKAVPKEPKKPVSPLVIAGGGAAIGAGGGALLAGGSPQPQPMYRAASEDTMSNPIEKMAEGFNSQIMDLAQKAGFEAPSQEKTAADKAVKKADPNKIRFDKYRTSDIAAHLAEQFGRPEDLEKQAASRPATAKLAQLVQENLKQS